MVLRQDEEGKERKVMGLFSLGKRKEKDPEKDKRPEKGKPARDPMEISRPTKEEEPPRLSREYKDKEKEKDRDRGSARSGKSEDDDDEPPTAVSPSTGTVYASCVEVRHTHVAASAR